MDDYECWVAEAARRQEAYLAFLKEIPSVYERDLMQQLHADDLDFAMIQANRKVRALEATFHPDRK